jgi:hypothetical protein
MSSAKEPRNVTALYRGTQTDTRWKRNLASRGSTELAERRLPRLVGKSTVSWLRGPRVSAATGVKICEALMVAYLVVFLMAAASQALPAAEELASRYEAAKVSTIVPSHVKQRSPCLSFIHSSIHFMLYEVGYLHRLLL